MPAILERPAVIEKAPRTRARTMLPPVLHVEERVALCPKCKAFQTVFFSGPALMETKKFYQKGDQIFHDCGATEPCRMFRGH